MKTLSLFAEANYEQLALTELHKQYEALPSTPTSILRVSARDVFDGDAMNPKDFAADVGTDRQRIVTSLSIGGNIATFDQVSRAMCDVFIKSDSIDVVQLKAVSKYLEYLSIKFDAAIAKADTVNTENARRAMEHQKRSVLAEIIDAQTAHERQLTDADLAVIAQNERMDKLAAENEALRKESKGILSKLNSLLKGTK